MTEASDTVGKPSGSGVATAHDHRSSESGRAGKLAGRMGVVELMMTVLAFSAPVVVVSGFIPFVIGFAGAGAPLAYVTALIVLLLFAVGFTTMSRYVPNPGAFYAYITAGLGRVLGLGACFLAIFAYLGMSVGTYVYFGLIARDFVKGMLAGPAEPISVYAFGCVAVTGVLGYFRIDLSAKVLSVAMLCEVLIVAIFDAAVLKDGGPQGLSFEPFTLHAFMSGSVGLAVVFAATCFLGFEATAVFREEVRNPEKTVPRATYLSVASIGIFYVISTWAIILAYGADRAQGLVASNYEVMFPNAVDKFVGVWAKDVVVVLIMTSAFACLLAVQNILARYAYSLGVDRVLPGILGRVHKRHSSPYISSLVVSALTASILFLWTLTGADVATTYSVLAGTGGFAILVLMFMTGLSVVIFFIRRRDIKDSTCWHKVVAPTLSAASMGVVLFFAAKNFTTMTGGSTAVAVALQLVMLVIFASGMVLAVFYRHQRPDVYARIGRQ
jgi:amino acid transporter